MSKPLNVGVRVKMQCSSTLRVHQLTHTHTHTHTHTSVTWVALDLSNTSEAPGKIQTATPPELPIRT